jgi:hypothetical protein
VVRLEGDLGARLLARPDLAKLADGVPAFVALREDLAVALHLELEPRTEGVHHGDTHTVEPAGDLVALLVELPAGMERRQYDLRGRALFRRMLIRRNPAAVILHRDRVVVVDRDGDLATEARERLVDRIVHDLVHEVMETVGSGRSDVHRRSFADRFEAFQHLDGTRVVAHRCSTPHIAAASCGLLRRQVLLHPRWCGAAG